MIKKTFGLVLIGLIIFLLVPDCQAFDYNYSNPIGHYSLTSFLGGLLGKIQGYVGYLAVLFIVIGGVMYITAGGKDSQLTLAKNTIVASLIGLALALGGPSLLAEIKSLFPTTGTLPPNFQNARTIPEILTKILDFVLTLIVILASLALIYSGLSYLGAGGENSKVDKAKKIFVYSIIALLVAGSSLIIINFILSLLEGNLA